jgi:Bacterial Ig-like domain (group 3)
MSLRRWPAARAFRPIAPAALALVVTLGIAFPQPARAGTYPFRFFAPTSFWNTRLTSEAAVDPRSAEIVASFDGEVSAELDAREGPSISTTSYSVPLYTVPEDQGTVRVQLKSSLSAPALRSAFEEVPLPPDPQPAEGNDGHLAVWQPSTGRLWEFWRLIHGENGWQASWGGAMQDVRSDSGTYESAAWPGADQSWGASASSLPIVGGLITLEDLEKGMINHALAIGIPNVRQGAYASPAGRSDGKSADPLSLPEGAHLRLDPDLNLAALNLPPLTLMIARAAQRYGIYVRDTAHDVTFYGQDPAPNGTEPYRAANGYFEGEPVYRLLESFPWSHLQLMEMRLHPTQRPPTITTLSLSAPSVAYGAAGAAEVSVSAPEGLMPSGWVTVKAAGAQLCAAKLEGGVGHCSMSAKALNAGAYSLTAVYPGTADLAGSVAEPAPLTVGAAPTTTTLSLSAPSVTYASEGAVKAEVSVGAADGIVPKGWVTVKAGQTQLCAAKLEDGASSCSMSAKALGAGVHSLTAEYPGTPDLGASGSEPAALTVGAAPTATTLSLSADWATYGSEGTVAAEFSVGAPGGLTTGGSVTIKAGQTTLCAAKLEGGVGSCAIGPKALNAGAHLLTATYHGTADLGASGSEAAALTVGAAPTATTLSLSAPSVLYGSERSVVAQVSVSASAGLVPGGSVTIRSGQTQLCAAKLEGGVGQCSMSAKALDAGEFALTASYPGTPDLGASGSEPASLTVGAAPTTSRLSLSAPSALYGSEQTVAAEITASAPAGLVPTGWVNVKSGQTLLCAAKLEAGVGHCSMNAWALDVGEFTLTAVYPGTPDLGGSASEPAGFRVGAAPG